MTHAWLFTGPPGSGRSVAARAFAAALQCAARRLRRVPRLPHHARPAPTPTCGSWCRKGCPSAVGEMRALVLRAASTPTGGRWQVVLIEDADRLTEAAGNALLKAIEEPPPRTVFLLCTPVHPPRRHLGDHPVPLPGRTAAAAAGRRGRRGAGPPGRHRRRTWRAWAAAAAQGHVGRARRLARDPEARARREAVLAVPRRLTGVGACFDAASALIEAAEAEAAASVVRGRRDASGPRWRPRSAPAAPAGARPARSGAPPGSSRTWRRGRSPGPPGPSATPWTGRWSTWPASTGTC